MPGTSPQTYTKIIISIIEDSEIHIEWLKSELSEDNKIEMASIDRLGRKGIESIKKYNPDIVLLDFQMEDLTGIEVAKFIKSYNPSIKVFILTAHTETAIVERLINDNNIDALAIKGSHYFENNFLSAIHHVAQNGTYIDPSLLIKLRESKNSNGLSSLTKREFEIFIQINIGKTDEKIAEDLCIELSHVRNVKSRVIKKTKDNDIAVILSKLIENSHTTHKIQ